MNGQPQAKRQSHVEVATASLIGTAIEWYDFFLSGTAAALRPFGVIATSEARTLLSQ
jgi:hypothetical protein